MSSISSTNELNVLYQSDDNYAMVSGISIASLLINNSHIKKINIFYCEHEVGDTNKSKLKSLVSGYKNASIKFINSSKYNTRLKELKVRPWHGVYVTWLKLFVIKDISIKTDRILYINPHTIINSQLDYLLDLDFEGKIMALSYDCLINSHKSKIGLDPKGGYYNCGIMLINHKRWINESISKKIEEHLVKKSDYVIADQDLCNVMFKGDILKLGVEYNFSSAYYAYNLRKLLRVNELTKEYFYSYENIMAEYYSPIIIHSLFGIKGKPWMQKNNHPNKELWAKYIKRTPWSVEEMPIAKKTLNWRLYDLLPKSIFMYLYKVSIKRKFG